MIYSILPVYFRVTFQSNYYALNRTSVKETGHQEQALKEN